MTMFDHLNPGDNCENIHPRGSMRDVPEEERRTAPQAEATCMNFYCALSSEEVFL